MTYYMVQIIKKVKTFLEKNIDTLQGTGKHNEQSLSLSRKKNNNITG